MTDLLNVLPDFGTSPFAHLLPSLDKSLVTVSDILTLDVVDVAKRAQLPSAEVQKLAHAILAELHSQYEPTRSDHASDNIASVGAVAPSLYKLGLNDAWDTISTLDDQLDTVLGGGISPGYVVEITGESGAGKTQFLLTFLLSVQLSPPNGLSKSALYISTEAALATSRLNQLLSSHPRLCSLTPNEKPSLNRILSIQTPDLESQDHILRYQVPVAIKRHNVGLLVIDSVAANYRAEFERPGSRGVSAMAQRSVQLMQLGAILRSLARTHNIAIVVANQVADRFRPQENTSVATSRATSFNSYNRDISFNFSADREELIPPHTDAPLEAASIPLTSPDALTLDHQQRWFTGWGDVEVPSIIGTHNNLKTPSLGLVWTNQLSCRIALLKFPIYSEGQHLLRPSGTEKGYGLSFEHELAGWRRSLKVVFAPWIGPTHTKGIDFELSSAGVRTIAAEEPNVKPP